MKLTGNGFSQLMVNYYVWILSFLAHVTVGKGC